MFLLKAGEQLEDMKTFVKAFINSADIGMCLTISIGLVEVFERVAVPHKKDLIKILSCRFFSRPDF